MEENNKLTGQRILIIFLILIMGGIIFAGVKLLTSEDSPTKNTLATENIIDKQNNNENVVNEAAENENTIDVEEEEDNSVTVTEVNVIKDIKKMADEEIESIVKNTLNEYQKIQGYEKSNIGPMPYLLAILGLETEEDLDELSRGQEDSNGYIKSNTDYEKFKNVLLQYVTEDYFIKYFSQYRNIDGKVAFCDCAGGGFSIEITDVNLKSNDGNKYVFGITIKDLEIYNNMVEGESAEEEEYLFENEVEFEYVDDRLVISKYNEQIILEGVYSMEASDVAYEFYKDGTAEYSTNMAIFKGTYTMVGEKELRIIWEEKTEWDPITSEETVKRMSGREYVDVIDETNIVVRTEVEGKTYSNEFTKLEN